MACFVELILELLWSVLRGIKTVDNIIPNRAWFQNWLLLDYWYLRFVPVRIQCPDIMTTESDWSTLWIIEPLNKSDDAWFSTSWWSYKGDDLILRYHKRHIVANLNIWLGWIIELDVFEFDFTNDLVLWNFNTTLWIDLWNMLHHFHNLVSGTGYFIHITNCETHDDE